MMFPSPLVLLLHWHRKTMIQAVQEQCRSLRQIEVHLTALTW